MLQNTFRCVVCGRLVLLSESLQDGAVAESLTATNTDHGRPVTDDACRVCLHCARGAFTLCSKRVPFTAAASTVTP